MATDGWDIDIKTLTDWLARQPADQLWAVDGEWAIMESMSLPVPGAILAAALLKRSEKTSRRIRVSPPPGLPTPTTEELPDWAQVHGNEDFTFGLAWLVNGEPSDDDVWLLTRDRIAEKALQEDLEETATEEKAGPLRGSP